MIKKIVIICLLLILAFPLGAQIAGKSEKDTPIGKMSFSAQPDINGGGSFYVPVADWGIRFPLFKSPVLVKSEPRSIEREAALSAATGNETILKQTEQDIYSGAKWAVIKTLVISLILIFFAGWVLSKLIPSLGSSFPFAALVGGASLSALVFLLALTTYNPSAIERPSFYARGAELSQILDSIKRESEGERGSYEDNFRKTLTGISSLLAGEPLPPVSSKDSLILASDLHTNALALPSLTNLSEKKPLLLVGDFGWEGNDREAEILAPKLAQLSNKVIAVSGNHDSSGLMKALTKEGITVLGKDGVLQPDGSWKSGQAQVLGLSVRGWEDPLEWNGEPGDPERQFELSTADASREKQELWNWWQQITKKPDILMIHQPELANFLANRLSKYPRPLTIVVGHDHKQWVKQEGNVSIIDAGSVGAGGIFGIGRESAEMAEIYFSINSKRVEAIDMIQINPLDGRGRAERITLERGCNCRYNIPEL